MLAWLKGQGAKGQPALDAHATLLALLEQNKATRERDLTLAMPKQILHALQVNLRAGALPPAESDGRHYLKIPLNRL